MSQEKANVSPSEALIYSVPLAPVAATLPEGLRVAFRLYAEGKTGWMILIGTIYV